MMPLRPSKCWQQLHGRLALNTLLRPCPHLLPRRLHPITAAVTYSDETRTSGQIPSLTAVSDSNDALACTSKDLYAYTAQRWMWDEPRQLRSRYVWFDLNALIRAAEKAAGEDAVCADVSKLPEGNFNKAFLVTMRDGRQLVVKIPNPNAGPSHYTTASEVATMAYVFHPTYQETGANEHALPWLTSLKVRKYLKIPVPKVLAYCTRASESRLGSEYIVMEKAPGIELGRIWGGMKPRDKLAIVKQLATITAKLSAARFSHYGSIYYHRDISGDSGINIDDTFAIGPTVGRSWFDDRRGEIDVNRGPCTG
jgi:serine/threonine protein kinase